MRVLQSLFAAAAALALAAQVGNAEQQLQHQGQQVLSAADSSVTALRRSAQQESSLAGLNGDLDLTEEEREHAALLSKLSSERAAMRVQQAAHSLSAHTEWHDEELKEAQEAVFIEELLKLTGIDSDGLPVVEGESEGEDALLLEVDESEDAKDRTEAEGGLEAGRIDLADNSTAAAFLEMAATASAEMVSMAGLEKVHGYCEICTRQIQMYQRALPDLCSGLTDTFFITVSSLPSLPCLAFVLLPSAALCIVVFLLLPFFIIRSFDRVCVVWFD